MKMKKMLMCVAAGAVAISCANANDINVNQIRTACQNSDKTLWVERNQVCIPRNPCKSEKFNHYCSFVFRNIETQGVGYKILVDLYARAHNLSCKPVSQDAKLVGQDYVVCDGTDVMVFEFDDIHDHAINKDMHYLSRMTKALCSAVEGQKVGEDWSGQCSTSRENCQYIKDILDEYGFVSSWSTQGAIYYEGSHICDIRLSTDEGGYMGDVQF